MSDSDVIVAPDRKRYRSESMTSPTLDSGCAGLNQPTGLLRRRPTFHLPSAALRKEWVLSREHGERDCRPDQASAKDPEPREISNPRFESSTVTMANAISRTTKPKTSAMIRLGARAAP